MNIKNYKYLLILILALFIGCNKTYAASKGYDSSYTCYYKSGENVSVYVPISYNKSSLENMTTLPYGDASKGVVMYFGGTAKSAIKRNVKNWGSSATVKGVTVPAFQISVSNGNIQCPNYLAIVKTDRIKMILTDNESTAKSAVDTWNSKGKDAYYASNVSAESFWGTACSGKSCIIGEDVTVTCSTLFDSDVEGEESLGSMINTALSYIRIIVPILIILLGSLDLAKAVISSKEDEMKKAQSTFIKRLIAGVAVFFIPILVNIVMNFADIVWDKEGYTHCELTEINN